MMEFDGVGSDNGAAARKAQLDTVDVLEVQGCSTQMRMVSSVNWPHVVNLGNSIIGVSVLAMPFCFQQCGIILGTILLLFCTWLTLVSCQLLMKAGITSRRKSYEFLAYHTLGGGGKFVIEFLLIGLQLGTMIAQIVVIGDLGPSIVSKFTGFENTNGLRSALIVILCLFVGLPLGLLKNVRSLSSASTMCICFYTIFVISMIFISIPTLWLGNWFVKVRYWRTEGLFQCIPIFSLAFGCQTQLFILYDDLPEPSFKEINKIVSNAVNICSVAYLLVGFFGYIAFCSTEITGDIINMLTPSLFTDIIKMAFVLSIAVTFPLIIFPCRTSLYTMLFPRRPKTSDGFEMSHQIPELHFKLMTVAIVVISMVIGMNVPNVEFILGLNGATMGTLICYIMPALFFLKVMSVTSEGKTLAKLVLVMGILVLLISTYTTLNFQDKSHHAEHQEEKRLKDNIAAKEAVQDIIAAKQPPIVDNVVVDNVGNHEGEGHEKMKEKDAHRHEPPIPKAPDDLPEVDQSNEKVKAVEAKKKTENEKKDEESVAVVKVQGNDHHGDDQDAKEDSKDGEKAKADQEGDNTKLKKQEEGEKKQEELLHKLEEQQQEQKKILEEQRELLKELKKHREEEHKEKLIDDKAKENVDVQGGVQGLPNVVHDPNVVAPQQKIVAQPNLVPDSIHQKVPVNLAVEPNLQKKNVVPQQNKQFPADNQPLPNLLPQRDSGNLNIQPIPQKSPQVKQQPEHQQPVAHVNQPIINQQPVGQANQPIVNQQPVGQANQPIVNQQPAGQANQPIIHRQPVAHVNQPIVNQQPAGQANQPIVIQQRAGQANQPIVNQQPAGQANQPIVNQQPAGQANQPIVNQQPAGQANQPIVNQQPAGQANQPIVNQQPAGQANQPIVNQQPAGQANQPIANQQPAGQANQPIVNQQPAGQANQPIVNQQPAGQANQPIVNQQPAGQANQPIVNQQPAGQANQPIVNQQPAGQANQPMANQQGRHLMLEKMEKGDHDPNIHKGALNEEHSVRHKRDVLMQMKDENQFIDKVKSKELSSKLDGIYKKHFLPIAMRSLKSAKES